MVLYLVEQLPHCDLLRLIHQTERFVCWLASLSLKSVMDSFFFFFFFWPWLWFGWLPKIWTLHLNLSNIRPYRVENPSSRPPDPTLTLVIFCACDDYGKDGYPYRPLPYVCVVKPGTCILRRQRQISGARPDFHTCNFLCMRWLWLGWLPYRAGMYASPSPEHASCADKSKHANMLFDLFLFFEVIFHI